MIVATREPTPTEERRHAERVARDPDALLYDRAKPQIGKDFHPGDRYLYTSEVILFFNHDDSRTSRKCEMNLIVTRPEGEGDDRLSKLSFSVHGYDWEDAEIRLVRECRQLGVSDALETIRRSL